MPLKIVCNDIVKMRADAIVNAANPYIYIGRGVDSCIYEAAGRERLFAARQAIGEIPPGQAAITPAFDLQAKYIIHVVSPIWRGGENQEELLLRSAYESIMRLAVKHGCKSVAVPLLGTGNNRFPRGMSLGIARSVMGRYLAELDDFTVYLVAYDRESFDVAADFFPELKDYLKEKLHASMYASEVARRDERYQSREILSCQRISEESGLWREFSIPEPGKTFSDYLFELIDAKHYSDTEVYKRSNIDRKLFSKLRQPQYVPGKKTVLALAIGMRLNMAEAKELLRYAGMTFSPSNVTDLVVRYFIEHKHYDINDVNVCVFEHCGAPLN